MRRQAPCLLAALALALACAKAPMASPERDAAAKTFAPVPGKAVLYIYRDEGFFGGGVKVPIVINSRVIGDTVGKSYFRLVLDPGDYELKCKAEKDVIQTIAVEAGKVYFFQQEMKMGLLSNRCGLSTVSDDAGRAAVATCRLLDAPEVLPE